jgi:hypothetical protein
MSTISSTTSGTLSGSSTLSATPTAQLGGLTGQSPGDISFGGRRLRHRGGQNIQNEGEKQFMRLKVTKDGRRRHRGGQTIPPIQAPAGLRGGNDTESWDIEMGAKEASNDEYNALDAAEKGEAGSNVVGGTRRRRHRRSGRKSRKGGRKTRRHRKRSHRRH